MTIIINFILYSWIKDTYWINYILFSSLKSLISCLFFTNLFSGQSSAVLKKYNYYLLLRDLRGYLASVERERGENQLEHRGTQTARVLVELVFAPPLPRPRPRPLPRPRPRPPTAPHARPECEQRKSGRCEDVGCERVQRDEDERNDERGEVAAEARVADLPLDGRQRRLVAGREEVVRGDQTPAVDGAPWHATWRQRNN